MLDMSKLTTSKNFTAWSPPVVQSRSPSAEETKAWMTPKCA